jgi:choline dehydrogenase-like flavoprotein
MRVSAMRERMWGFCMLGEDLPQASNAVDLSPSVRDVRGVPVARVTYSPHVHEQAASAHHSIVLDRALREAGAEWTVTATAPGDISAWPVSKHVMGTTRMGSDPSTSVVDPLQRVWGVPNLVVADSSVFVTSAGYGPTLTLVALALRAATALTTGANSA